MSGLIGKVFVRSMSRIDSKTKVDLLHIVSGIRKPESQQKKKKSRQNPRRSVPAGLDAIPKMGFLPFLLTKK
jgi:hypothetical protein